MNLRLLSVSLIILLSIISVRPSFGEVFGPNITFNVNTGKIYSQKNAFDRWYPASITKMMTAYVVLREVKRGKISMLSPVRQSANSQSKPASKMGFPIGTILTVEAALKIILVKSANDVASAVAESVGGSEAEFSRLMNKYAHEIGMTSSHFVNPHGLHNVAQYTSAHDLGLLARQIYREFPEHSKLFGLQAIQVGKRKFRNHNALMRHFPGTIGMKTGFICAGGLSLVTASNFGKDIVVSVVLGASNGKERNVLAAELQSVARKRVESETLPELDAMIAPEFSRQPLDIRDYVCGKKRKRLPTLMFDDPAIEFFAVKTVPLEERQTRYLEKEPKAYTAVKVKLGGATGPDPFEILIEKSPILLTGEFAEGSGEIEPELRFKIKKGKLIAVPTKRPASKTPQNVSN